MFDIGMGEIFIFSVIALIVLGPEKLPVALKALAKWYVHIKKMISNIQQDIEKQLNISELREQMQTEIKRIEDLEQQMQQKFAVLERQHQQLLDKQAPVKKYLNYQHLHDVKQWRVPFCSSFPWSSFESFNVCPATIIPLKVAV